jgi:ubiquinone biosynthesis protein COQ9
MTENIYNMKHKIMLSVIEILPYEAFDSNIISKACSNIGLEPQYADLFFANGRMEILEIFRDHIDSLMLKRIEQELTQELGITARIYDAIKIRLELITEHKLAISKITSFFMIPWNHPKLYPYTWHSMNLIWKAAGKDKSTDFNYYTKRGLLTAAYCSTILYWLSDDSEGHQDTYDFLRRELKLIGSVGKKISSFRNL